MPLPDHFDLLAPLYERFILPRDPRELMARAGFPCGGALLDAGGGTGRISQFARGAADSIVVADLSHPMLAEARAKGGLLPVCTHTETLPFPNAAFARIIMVDTLHHVCDQRRTAAELWRVLAPGGRLVVEEPDVRYFGVKLIAVGEKLALMRSRFLSPPRMAELFRRPGAIVQLDAERGTAWIIVEKPPS
ncbi:MAG: class I SAM-dependent methyltransferase [Anaerolineales bacterium]